MAKIKMKIPVRKYVTRSVSRALKSPGISMRSLTCYVSIDRNNKADKKALEIRTVVRKRRASESNALPNQGNHTRKNRRLSVDSALVQSRRKSISEGLPSIHVPDAQVIPNDQMFPFDDEFVHRLNRMADNGDIAGDQPVETDRSNEQDTLMLSIEDISPNAMAVEVNTVESTHDASGDVLMNSVGENDGDSGDQNVETGISVAECNKKRKHTSLPAPFHIKGRRPSAGARKMDSIVEE